MLTERVAARRDRVPDRKQHGGIIRRVGRVVAGLAAAPGICYRERAVRQAGHSEVVFSGYGPRIRARRRRFRRSKGATQELCHAAL